MIRRRLSLEHRLCRVEFRGCYLYDSFSALWEIKVLGLQWGMVVRLKQKGLDGIAPPEVGPEGLFNSTREALPGPDAVRIDRLTVRYCFVGGSSWPSSLVE